MDFIGAMTLAVGLPAALAVFGLFILALVNTRRGPRQGDAGGPFSVPVQYPSAPESPQEKNYSFEASFGRKAAVWIGSASLAFGGFFLVKYSIDLGLLTVNARLLLGFLLGVLMILCASVIRLRGAANSARISQALAGAGIADLYATVYAASALYGIVPPMTGFIGMAAVTLSAIALSLRYGMGVALMGLLAGYVMPAFVPVPEPKAANLFFYLFLLTVGVFATARYRDWWAMGILALAAGISWVVMWGVGPFFDTGDCPPMALYILGASAAVAIFSPVGFRRPEWSDTASYISWGAAAPLMTFVVARSGYAMEEWYLFAALSLSGFAAAWFRPQQYRYPPLLCLALAATALVVWPQAGPEALGSTLLAFALVFGAGSLALIHLRPGPLWAALLASSLTLFYALGYFLIGDRAAGMFSVGAADVAHVWSTIAAMLALLFMILTMDAYKSPRIDGMARDWITGIFIAAAAAFTATVISIELPAKIIPAGFSAEILALSWLSRNTGLRGLRKVMATLLGVVIFWMALETLPIFGILRPGLHQVRVDAWVAESLRTLTQFGLTAIMLAASAILVRRKKDGYIGESLEMAAVAAVAAFLCAGAQFVLDPPWQYAGKDGFLDMALLDKAHHPNWSWINTNIFFALGLAASWTGRHENYRGYSWSGNFLVFFALFRVFFQNILQNPLVTGAYVGELPVFNGLILAYALPVVWLWLAARGKAGAPLQRDNAGILSTMIILLFFFVTMEVRQFFHPGDLRAGATATAEIYTYSAAWLVLGAGLLLAGTWRKNKLLRVASLAIMLFTIAKVFLYDASTLDGLYRVFSFLGLGVCLMALSWFYSRFVFRKP
ncbi:MAG: DUF2339 domain-containing protein [Alphaproteobacteria bacterium]|nr:MAG: DUF2339 domain-containing protein [Alphaproteobacteria bacterium]